MFDLEALRAAVARHGRVARVVVAEVQGSAPREVGAAMLVWKARGGAPEEGTGQSGTIGGGALEFEAAQAALTREGLTRHALGPSLGQCCGGAVALWTDHWDAARLDGLRDDVVARGPGEMPLAVARVLDRARATGLRPASGLVQGWMVEPVARPRHALWIWGAGHVGRALVAVLGPVPELALTWVDVARARFPDPMPEGVTPLWAQAPERLLPHAPETAHHLVLTYSHALDLALCDGLLRRGFASAGLIGSATKWARFRSRLRGLGHEDAQISRICCPIGQKHLGKAPQALAIGVAAQILSRINEEDQTWQTTRFSAFGD